MKSWYRAGMDGARCFQLGRECGPNNAIRIYFEAHKNEEEPYKNTKRLIKNKN